MRIAAVYLSSVRIELARARLRDHEKSAPLAVVIARPSTGGRGSALKDERSLLGGTRVDVVSKEARAHGVKRDETIAASRAKCAELLVRVVPEGDVRGVLEAVAEAALAFGRTASIDEARDVVCVDVTGCGHLFGEGTSGEEKLAAALVERVRAMHHAARACVADGPRVATAIARHRRSALPTIVPGGGNAAAIRALPLAALPIDAGSIAWLAKLGLARVGDLQKLPARGLATRLGAAHAEVMALLAGDDPAPLEAYLPPEIPEERAELEYGIDKTESLLFVAKMLCDRLAARLAGRAMAAARVEIVLSLDRAISREAALPAHATLALTFPAPLSTAPELLAIVRARVESWTIPAPILAVTLRAPELARKEGRALDLFIPEAKADRALPRLVAELSADLGDDRVGTLALANTWVPEERTRLVPFTARARVESAPVTPLVSHAPEPSRVLAVPLPADGVEPVRLLARIEAVAWWRLGVGRGRDFVAGWSARDGRMAWLEVDRTTGQARIKGWMD